MNTAAFRVLVLEDDERQLQRLARTVSRIGEPIVATTVEQARALLAKHDSLGALVLDVKVPDGSALDVLREARKRHPHAFAAILSAWHDPDVDRAVWDLDAYYFFKSMDHGERLQEFLALAKQQFNRMPDRLKATVELWVDSYLSRSLALADIVRRHVIDGETREQIAEARDVEVWTIRDQEEAIAAKTGHGTFREAVMCLMREAARADRPPRLKR